MSELKPIKNQLQNLSTQASPSSTPGRMILKTCRRCQGEFQTEEHLYQVAGKRVELTKDHCLKCEEELAEAARRREEERQQIYVSQVRQSWRDKCGIEARFQTKTFDNFEAKKQPAAFELAKRFAERFPYHDPCGLASIYLFSEKPVYGVGKTHLAAAIGNYIIQNWDGSGYASCLFFFISEANFLLRVRASFNHRRFYEERHETEDEVYYALIRAPLLILDDIGKEETDRREDDDESTTSSKFVRRAYWQVINGRYEAHRPTIITSNYSIERLPTFLGGPCTERIIEMTQGNIVQLHGKSHRLLPWRRKV